MSAWRTAAVAALRQRGIEADAPASCRSRAAHQVATFEVRVPSSQIDKASTDKVAHGITAEIAGAHPWSTPLFARQAAAELGPGWSVSVARAGAGLQVEVPLVSSLRAPVQLRQMGGEGLRIDIGAKTDGTRAVLDLGRSHAFIAGATDGGKTSIARTILAGLTRHNEPRELHIVVADPKNRLLAGPLSALCHLVLEPAVSDEEIGALLQMLLDEQQKRAGLSVGEVAELPYVVLMVDEAHNLGPHSAAALKLAREGREFKIRLVLISQVLKATDLDTTIKNQCMERICLSVAPGDWRTSQAVVESNDACKLIGRGDAYGFRQGRFQAAYARLATPEEGPDDPFWSEPFWAALTTRRPLARLGAAEKPATSGERAPGPSAATDSEGRRSPADDDADKPHWSQTPREMEPWQRDWIVAHAMIKKEGDLKMPGRRRTRESLGVGDNAAKRWLEEVRDQLEEMRALTQGTQATRGTQGDVIDLEARRKARGA